MEKEQLSMVDLIIETHLDLERQGPGSSEMTLRALSFLESPEKVSQVADLGCGTGGQTMVLAQHITGKVTGVDQFTEFIDRFNDSAENKELKERVKGVVGSIDDLPFERNSLDLIWSEGAIDNIGFEWGLKYWNDFLRKDGYVVVTCPSWFTDEHPDEVEKFWTEAESGINTVEHNVSIMQKSGYRFIASFALPEECWTKNYFIPRETKAKVLLQKYSGNQTAEDFFAGDKYEMELYSKYKQHYGYAFYIGQKI